MRATGGGEHRWGRLWPWPSPASPPAFPRYSEGTKGTDRRVVCPTGEAVCKLALGLQGTEEKWPRWP